MPEGSPTASPDAGVRRGLRARVFAWGLRRAGGSQHELFGDRWAALVEAAVHGRERPTVVEIGAGAGPTAPLLPSGTRWIAIEPNAHFHDDLRRAADRHGLDLDLVGGVAERLPVPDASADLVLSRHVLCSVDDVPGVLAEARRVLQPGGRFVVLEHVGAVPGSWMRRAQRLVRRPWGWLADGCRPDRDTAAAIEDAGFAHVEVKPFRVPPLGLASPHIAGWAER